MRELVVLPEILLSNKVIIIIIIIIIIITIIIIIIIIYDYCYYKYLIEHWTHVGCYEKLLKYDWLTSISLIQICRFFIIYDRQRVEPTNSSPAHHRNFKYI